MQRAWKRVKKYTYLIVFVLPALVVLGVRFGGAAAYLTPFVAFVLIPLLDLLVGEDRVNYSPDEEKALDGEPYYRAVTYAFVPVYWGVLAYVVSGAAAGGWSLAEIAGNTWSMGILSGIAIVVAHELGHKSAKLEKRLAKALLHPTFYGHFTQEHNLGHHLMVATPEDPASSRFGESFWRFYPRTVIGTFREIATQFRMAATSGRPYGDGSGVGESLQKLVTEKEGILEVQTYGLMLHVFVDDVERQQNEIETALAAQGITCTGMRQIEARMEEAFISLIKKQSQVKS